MAEKSAPTFVPKPEAAAASKTRLASLRRVINLLFAGSIFIFVLATIALILVFLYREYNNSQLLAKEQSLLDSRAEFDPDTVVTLNRFDTRLKVATNLLTNHVAFTKLFDEIADHTLTTVQFTSFEASINEEGAVKVSGTGRALNYEALALQSDAFAESVYVVNPIFTNFGRAEDATINFGFSFTVNADLINYSSTDNNISGTGSGESNLETGNLDSGDALDNADSENNNSETNNIDQ